MNIKNNKKGFTLIELLAVIIILAVIALIATPIVLNVVDNAKKQANKNSVYGLLDGAKLYYTESLLDSNKSNKVNGSTNIIDEISISGSKPESGSIYINSSGETALAVVYDKVCYKKNFNENEITESSDVDNCKIEITNNIVCRATESLATEHIGILATDNNKYQIGTEYICNPGDGVERLFYVIEDGDNTTLSDGTAKTGEVSLILNNNLGSSVWISEEDYNIASNNGGNYGNNIETVSFGPITATKELNRLTSGWINVSVSLPSDSQLGLIDNGLKDISSDLIPSIIPFYDYLHDQIDTADYISDLFNNFYGYFESSEQLANILHENNINIGYTYLSKDYYHESGRYYPTALGYDGVYIWDVSDTALIRPVITINKNLVK